MASSCAQAYSRTAPRAAKEWEILFVALANGWVGPGGILNCWADAIFSDGKLEDSVRIKPPKWEALRRSDLGSSEKAYLVVYIRVVVNREAFYVPLLEFNQPGKLRRSASGPQTITTWTANA